MTELTRYVPERLLIEHDNVKVQALLIRPRGAIALMTLAHGAGAGMEHPHLERLANRLADHRVATLRYQFPYMEQGSRRPDRAPQLEATVRAAVEFAREKHGDLPLFASGRSMGARMSARAHAKASLDVVGLVFFAFPLHRAVNLSDVDPSLERAEHPLSIHQPMLFLAGTRDRLSRLHLLEQTLAQTKSATLHVVDTADHSFVPTKKSGRDLFEVEEELATVTADWVTAQIESSCEPKAPD